MDELFTLRLAQDADITAINFFNELEGMDAVPSVQGITVAVNGEDQIVGYIRVVIGESGNAFINPIVVYKTWRKHGVGKALMDLALSEYGAIRLVSRGTAVPFYKALGYQECDWTEIDEGVSEDCANCSWRKECNPKPMSKFN